MGKGVRNIHFERHNLFAGQATSGDFIAPGFTADGTFIVILVSYILELQ